MYFFYIAPLYDEYYLAEREDVSARSHRDAATPLCQTIFFLVPCIILSVMQPLFSLFATITKYTLKIQTHYMLFFFSHHKHKSQFIVDLKKNDVWIHLETYIQHRISFWHYNIYNASMKTYFSCNISLVFLYIFNIITTCSGYPLRRCRRWQYEDSK